MEKKTIEMVREFHQVFNCTLLEKPGIPDAWTILIRIQLIQEELSELAEALAAVDRLSVLDALVDLQYVVDGTFLSFGIADEKSSRDTSIFQVTGISDLRVNLKTLGLLQCYLVHLINSIELNNMDHVIRSLCSLQDEVDIAFTRFGFMSVKQAAFEEVHRSNMTKLGSDGKPVVRPGGRVVKGPNYEKPNLEQFIKD